MMPGHLIKFPTLLVRMIEARFAKTIKNVPRARETLLRLLSENKALMA